MSLKEKAVRMIPKIDWSQMPSLDEIGQEFTDLFKAGRDSLHAANIRRQVLTAQVFAFTKGKAADLKAAEQHLASCKPCREELARRTQSLVEDSCHPEDRIHAAAMLAARKDSLPGTPTSLD